jgi:hypothetical protein
MSVQDILEKALREAGIDGRVISAGVEAAASEKSVYETTTTHTRETQVCNNYACVVASYGPDGKIAAIDVGAPNGYVGITYEGPEATAFLEVMRTLLLATEWRAA